MELLGYIIGIVVLGLFYLGVFGLVTCAGVWLIKAFVEIVKTIFDW